MTTPTELNYSKTHEWVKVDGTTAIVGISDHAQDALGDITFVELPKVGAVVKQHAACAVVESVKAASDINAPLSGTVSEVNSALEATPETLNSDPYGAGWIFKLTGINSAEVASLLDAAAYDAHAESEG